MAGISSVRVRATLERGELQDFEVLCVATAQGNAALSARGIDGDDQHG